MFKNAKKLRNVEKVLNNSELSTKKSKCSKMFKSQKYEM